MTRKIFLNASLLLLLAAGLSFSQTVWQKYEGNPVLRAEAEWESYGNINVTIVKVDNVYKLWYTGIGSRFRIGMATSIDGIHWTKSNANPVLDVGAPGDFDSEHVYTPMVVYYNHLYWMWYAGHNGQTWQIGLATSEDGVHWTKYFNNPVLKIGSPGSWDSNLIYGAFVMRDGSVFKMWYRGESLESPGKGSTGYAESADGIHWEKYGGNPVFSPVPGTWDARSLGIYPVLKRNGIYEAWYGGNDGTVSRLGYATSVDGIHWERYQKNPILAPTNDGSWESESISTGFVLFEENIYKFWYTGKGPNGWSIGYATSTTKQPTERLVSLPRVYGLPGDTLKVTLYADSIAGISGGDAVIRFDSQVLQATEVQTTDFTRNFFVAANLDTPGVARISFASAHGAIGGLGGLLNIRMVVASSLQIPDTTFSRPLKLIIANFYNEIGQSIPTKKHYGLFILGKPRGDVNFDGRVNAADAILTLRIAAGLLQPTPNQATEADVDANRHVESIDASCILRRAVRLGCLTGGNSRVAAKLTISPFSADAGNQVETQLSIDGIDKLLSGDVMLQYDANALEITEIRPSAEMSGTALETNLNKRGYAKFSFAASSGSPAKNIAVVRLRAKVRIDEKSLRPMEATLFDGQGQRWNSFVTEVDDAPALPTEFQLEQNYPNPFYRQLAASASTASPNATQTQIRYALPQQTRVKLVIYDLRGRQVRVLEETEKTAGEYVQAWDGLDDQAIPVASGVYVYRLQVGENVFSKKMLLLE